MKDKRVARTERFNWEKYLRTFSLLQDRVLPIEKSYKYESLCLLAVDLGARTPRVLNHMDDFVELKLVRPEFAKGFSYTSLSIANFVDTLLSRFKERFTVSLED